MCIRDRVSGGIFLDMTIHDFDMACFLTDSDGEELYVNSAVLVAGSYTHLDVYKRQS